MAKSAVLPTGANRGITSSSATIPCSATRISQRDDPPMTSVISLSNGFLSISNCMKVICHFSFVTCQRRSLDDQGCQPPQHEIRAIKHDEKDAFSALRAPTTQCKGQQSQTKQHQHDGIDSPDDQREQKRCIG